MLTPRVLTLAAAAVLALSGTASAAAAAQPAAAAAAGAAGKAAAPAQARGAVTAVHLDCTGDTVTGTATVRAPRASTMRVDLQAQQAGGRYVATGHTTTLAVTTKKTLYAWSFNVATLPASVKRYRAVVTLGTGSETSNAVPVSRCAPGQEVPEVPAALLVPVTLAATGAGVLALRRRAEGPVPA